MRDAVLRYLAENPDKRNQPASELALTSLKTAFQCVEPAPPVAVSAVNVELVTVSVPLPV